MWKDAAWLRGFESHIPEILRGLGEAFTEMTAEQFEDQVRKFFAKARHPRFGNSYQQISYRPMRELIELLKAHDFRVFIASGGGRDFMRVISEETYGVYREQVIGTAPEHEYRNGQLFRVAKMLGTIDNGPGKPVHIFAQTGRLPALAGGNSDGDIEMLECARFGLLVHHDDAKREYAYDNGAEKALAAAKDKGWTVVSMKNDWKTVFLK
jgi:phosphoserine phosphatase